ncbi:hypothetical protein NX847_31055, partial [Burkholderia thailandensis]|nr:hypothetical protein [Burkholderia thailandensis]
LMAAANWRHGDFVHLSASFGYVLGMAIFVVLATVLKIRLRLFAWLGEISYSIYLLHGIPLYLLLWACERYGITDLPLGFYMALPALPAIALSWASHRLCEAPFVRFAHALPPNRPAAAAAATACRTLAGRTPPRLPHRRPPLLEPPLPPYALFGSRPTRAPPPLRPPHDLRVVRSRPRRDALAVRCMTPLP